MTDSAAINTLPRSLMCARCGTAFACGSTVGQCWCAEEDFRLPMPALDSADDCLCPACLRKVAVKHARHHPRKRMIQ